MFIRKAPHALTFVFLALALSVSGYGESLADSGKDPLASWNDGENKSRILAFVESVTQTDSPDFVPEAERIATFDNDGNLWSE